MSVNSSERLRKKVAVISGGGTGIGLATAQRLLADGYAVTAVGVDREDQVSDEIRFVSLDVTNDVAVREFSAGFEQVGALVNAAGVIAHGGGEFDMVGFRRVIDVNLNGTASLCFAFQKALAAARGSVVNFASMYAIFGSGGTPAYAASKGAIVQLTKSLAVAWSAEGIRVNAIAPGWIETRLSANARTNEDRTRGIMERLPMNRWGTPGVIRFLLSEDAAYVNGALYTIDGGYSAA